MNDLFVVAAALLAGWVIQYLLLRRRIDRLTATPAQISRIREEVDRMIVQLNQTTDRNVSLIEDRINQLMELMAKADKKIGILRREGEKHEVSQTVYSHLVRNKPLPEAVAARSPDEAAGGSVGVEAGPGGTPGPVAARGPGAETSGRDDRRTEILRLHRAGFTAPVIARQMRLSRGEVELVISLSEGRK